MEELCEECSLPLFICEELQDIVYTETTTERRQKARELRKKYKEHYNNTQAHSSL